jgi:hypothetical protein
VFKCFPFFSVFIMSIVSVIFPYLCPILRLATLNWATRWRPIGRIRKCWCQTFYSSRGSCVDADIQYCREFSVCVAPSMNTIFRIVKRFEETGSFMIIVRKDANLVHLFVRETSSAQHGRQ